MTAVPILVLVICAQATSCVQYRTCIIFIVAYKWLCYRYDVDSKSPDLSKHVSIERQAFREQKCLMHHI